MKNRTTKLLLPAPSGFSYTPSKVFAFPITNSVRARTPRLKKVPASYRLQPYFLSHLGSMGRLPIRTFSVTSTVPLLLASSPWSSSALASPLQAPLLPCSPHPPTPPPMLSPVNLSYYHFLFPSGVYDYTICGGQRMPVEILFTSFVTGSLTGLSRQPVSLKNPPCWSPRCWLKRPSPWQAFMWELGTITIQVLTLSKPSPLTNLNDFPPPASCPFCFHFLSWLMIPWCAIFDYLLVIVRLPGHLEC